jgi:hypothetical protein
MRAGSPEVASIIEIWISLLKVEASKNYMYLSDLIMELTLRKVTSVVILQLFLSINQVFTSQTLRPRFDGLFKYYSGSRRVSSDCYRDPTFLDS